MVRTKVKNKGSKAALSSNILSHTSHSSSSRASAAKTRPRMNSSSSHNHQPFSNMTRSTSCPGTTTTSQKIDRRILSNSRITSLNNEIFQPNQYKRQNTTRDISIRTVPSTMEDDFSDDFHFEALCKNGANQSQVCVSISVDGICDAKTNSNMNTIDMGRRNDLPLVLMCEDNPQDDMTTLGNSSHSNTTQASDIMFQQKQMDPFQPKPILEHQSKHNQQQQQQQFLRQQMQHQQRQQQRLMREHEYEMLQLQIETLENQLGNLDQQQQCQQPTTNPNNNNNNNNNSNYLCNGVAAIELGDRGIVTPTISPNEIGQGNTNHSTRHLMMDTEELMLNPTPIFTPLMSTNHPNNNSNSNINFNNNNSNHDYGTMDVNMRRSISSCSFPSMISGNAM